MASDKPAIPAWQQDNTNPDTTSEPENTTLEHARKFLDHETVKASSPEEKRIFLKSKGLDDSQVTTLLNEPRDDDESAVTPPAVESTATPDGADNEIDTQSDRNEAISMPTNNSASATSESSPRSNPPAPSFTTESRAPIITYPEFLTKPQRPPPLITPSRLTNILAVSGGIWALLYGISGLVIRPMVDNLNEARSDYYEHVNEKMSQLVEKLESTASEVPYKNGKPLKSQLLDRAVDDNDSITSDPTELFHRDIGTQTSPPPSVVGATTAAASSNQKPVDVQADRLSSISALLRELTLMHTQRAEGNADLRTSIGEIRDQVDKIGYPPVQDFSTMGGLGYGQSADPNDEFKKTKDAIRSVKGIFLSSRSFPAVATR
ncbi:peroxisomal membrane anchor protein conserved region-domain-containing protein [Astrocystis sublimbata]|nr:peroxisomal membrane anchor protein conserved region-domain-containing protein [Astrocystis sublimbata]